MRFIAAALLAALLAVPISAHAADADKQKSILELIELVGLNNVLEQITLSSFNSSIAAIQRQNGTLETKRVELIRDVFVQTFKENSPTLIAKVAISYEKAFSQQEIDDLITFYKSPTGRKSIKIMPQLAQEGMKDGIEWANQLVPLIRQRIVERINKEKAESPL